MQVNEIAVGTITWARTPQEGAALLQALERLCASGLPISVADRGLNGSFTEALGRLPLCVVVPSTVGLVAQVQCSVTAAASGGRRFILYIEPDKDLFFSSALQTFVERAVAADDVGVTIASRSAASFETFPPLQRYTEEVLNTLCGDMLGIPGDYTYGPFLLHRTLLPELATLPPLLGWGWRLAMFRMAQRRGLRIEHIVGDYPCPPDQRHESQTDRTHRVRQLSQNLLGLCDD